MVGLIILVFLIIVFIVIFKDNRIRFYLSSIVTIVYGMCTIFLVPKYDIGEKVYNIEPFADSTYLKIIDNCRNGNEYIVKYVDDYFGGDIKDSEYNVNVIYSSKNKMTYKKKTLSIHPQNLFTFDVGDKEDFIFEINKEKISNIYDTVQFKLSIEDFNSIYGSIIGSRSSKKTFKDKHFNAEEVNIKIGGNYYNPVKIEDYLLYFNLPKCVSEEYNTNSGGYSVRHNIKHLYFKGIEYGDL